MSIRLDNALVLAIKLGIVLVLLVPLVVSQSTLFPYVVGKAIYARGLIEIIFACWLILAMRNPLYRLPRSWVLWLFGMYLFVSLIAAWTGVSFQRSFWGDYRRMGGVFGLMHWFAFAVVLVSVLREARQWRWLLNANLGVSLFVALLGLAQHYDVRVLGRFFWYLQPTGRVDITFGNPTYVAAYMLVNVFVALAFLAHSYRRLPQPARRQTRRRRPRRRVEVERLPPWLLPWRAFWAATLLLDLWVLTLSGTRGAFVGLVAGLLVAGVAYVLWGNRKELRVLAGALASLLLLVVLVAPLTQDTGLFRKAARSSVIVGRFQRAITLGVQDPSIRMRLSSAGAGLEAFLDAPVLGWGPENFVVAFDRHADIADFPMGTRMADQAHDETRRALMAKNEEKLSYQRKNPIDSLPSELSAVTRVFEQFLEDLENKRVELAAAQAEVDKVTEALAEEPPTIQRTRILSNDVLVRLMEANPGTIDPETLQDLTVVDEEENPVYVFLKEKLSEATTRVAALSAEVAQLERKTAEFRVAIQDLSERIAQSEVQQRAFDTDIAVLSNNLQSLAQSLQEARLAKEEQASSIRVVESAVVPQVSTGPSPQEFMVPAGAIGLLVGTVVALLVHYVQTGGLEPQRSKAKDE